MKKVHDLESYYAIVNEVQNRNRPIFTNNFLFPESIQRYISLERLYYEECSSGLFLYLDEETHYQVYYYLKQNVEVAMSAKDKPVLIRNLYVDSKKKDSLLYLEELLRVNGFKNVGRMGQVLYDPSTVLEKKKKEFQLVLVNMETEGFILAPINSNQLGDLSELKKGIKDIPYYQFEYYSDQEILEEAAEGRYVGIVNKEGILCGARQILVEGKGMYGWVAVREDYTGIFGLGAAFSHYSLNYALQHGLKGMGWIEESNTRSVKYHKKLGYQWTGKYMDEWLLDTVYKNAKEM